MSETENRKDWLSQAAARVESHTLLKVVGTTVSITVFMVIYFIIARNPQFPVTYIPWTPVDRLIPFQPWGIFPYASLWVYISLVPSLLLLKREAGTYMSAVALLSILGLTIFVFWPTDIVQPDIDWRRYSSIAFLKSVGASGNACPSMHVAFSVLTALWLHKLLKWMSTPAFLHWINLCWCLLIIWSTLILKQHLIIDVICGALLGLAIAVPHLYLWPRLKKKPEHPTPFTN